MIKNRSFPFDMDEVMEEAMSCNNMGFCLSCGSMHDGIEPDARKVECDCCGERQVYGAEEILLMYGG
jgi:hypothetical protein